VRLVAVLLLLCACASPVEPPMVQVSPLDDTTDTRGPYAVTARVTSKRNLRSVELVWHDFAAGPLATARVPMAQDDLGLFRAAIPGHGAGARIGYGVEAVDDEGDRAADPAAGLYLFSVLPSP
jgi:hypothetical protein